MVGLLSVIVGDLDVVRAVVGPDEADSVLVVDADGVLAGALADQLLQATAGPRPQAVAWAEEQKMRGRAELARPTVGVD